MATKKSLFEYDNYRLFLRDFYLTSKASDKKFSFRYFSRISGFKSSNFLNLVMQGKSNVSNESIGRLAAAMKLNREEFQFFKNLVLFNQAPNSEEREKHAKELVRSRTHRKIYPLLEPQFHYFEKWFYVVIRSMVGLKDFKEDPEWICERISPTITTAEARQALEELQTMGLIQRGPDGKLSPTNQSLMTPNEVASSSISRFHREMMKRASESIDTVSRENRDLSTMTVGISAETAREIKEMVQQFRNDIVDLVAKDQHADRVYQLNFHIFPLTQIETPVPRKTEKGGVK